MHFCLGLGFTFLGNSRLVSCAKHVELVCTAVAEQVNHILGYEMTSPVYSKPLELFRISSGKFYLSQQQVFQKSQKVEKSLVPYSCILFETIFLNHLINYPYQVMDFPFNCWIGI